MLHVWSETHHTSLKQKETNQNRLEMISLWQCEVYYVGDVYLEICYLEKRKYTHSFEPLFLKCLFSLI